MPASRPWVQRTALGTPVVPEVKIRRKSDGLVDRVDVLDEVAGLGLPANRCRRAS